jgi:multidrug efflux pump subunit AcrA (membrane-fusion protein)
LITGLKNWFIRRFVVICEIVGYALSGLIGATVLYSLFVQVEIHVRITSQLAPVSTPVRAESDALLVEYLISSGQNVEEGQPVCRIEDDPEMQRRALARHRLEEAVAVLSQSASGDSAALERARQALEALPKPGTGVLIHAPSSGVIMNLKDLNQFDLVRKDEDIALIYDPAKLALSGSLGTSKADAMVAANQVARVKLPEFPEPLVGRVEAVESTDSTKLVTIRFDNVPQPVQQHFSTLLLEKDNAPLPSVTAEVIVGHQSLFSETFGRKRPS